MNIQILRYTRVIIYLYLAVYRSIQVNGGGNCNTSIDVDNGELNTKVIPNS